MHYDNQANAINNSGQIVGRSGMSNIVHAYLFAGDGGPQDLGTLYGWDSEALAISNSGLIVGDVNNSVAYHAFVYSGGTMQDLNSLIDPSLGITLQEATGVNDSGQIVCTGTNASGKPDGFLLTPLPTPEPSTLALLAAGGLAMLWHVRQRQTRNRLGKGVRFG